MKPTAEQIINSNPDNRMAFSMSAMTRETDRGEEPDEPSYDEFISNVAGETQPVTRRAQNDLEKLKNGEYVLQPAWSPMSLPSKNDTVFHLDADDDVPSDSDGEKT